MQKPVTPVCWHIITSEYPPQAGGVSDYTYLVSAGLAGQGDEVHVWCPASSSIQPREDGVAVHRELGAITPADLRRVGRRLDQFPAPRRILVQWVPHGYGRRSMNVAFCWWLWNRAAGHGDRVEIMLHEPYLPFRAGSVRQNAAALVHRLMTILLLRAPERVWVSIPEWTRCWRPYALGRRVRFEWLPIPSSIRVADNPVGVQTARGRYAAKDSVLAGHFGTYGWPITSLLEPVLMALAEDPGNITVLLMGIGSEQFREALVRKQPRLGGLFHATGALSPEDLSCHVAACDLLIQPYPDGVSSRRTSFMVGLSHGKPIVTTTGPLSEPFWEDTGALALAPAGDTNAFLNLVRRLQTDASERERMGRAAKALYHQRFDISHTITSLRRAAGAVEPCICPS
jgi:glycosyltransferase involved in cell wall biosynthesis